MIEVDRLHVRVGEFELRDISFSVPAHRYAVLMGKTGSGKTTLMESICGLRPVVAGTIRLQTRDVTRLKPGERGIGLVPQDRALFPTMTVQQQIELPMMIRRWPAQRQRARTMELAQLLGIDKILHRRPIGLSGGEAQRVALGRALSFEPAILLLDEPLSALDAATRSQMHDLLRKIREYTQVTVLHITHNIEDAEQLSDVRLWIEDGVLSQQ